LRRLYRATLSAAGYAVVAVADGVDALRYVDLGRSPDAVVLDLELPRLHGHDVRRELAAHAPTSRIPIVVVTGSDTTQLNERDFACILKKPITPEALLHAVENCLRRHLDR
jgi:chemosensory pili system protein ChpA (sensor histidine kinase/response regulator)